jgi:hypothetical protein
MSGEIHTDVLLDAPNMPFITLMESKIRNTWYHHKLDCLFVLTSRGFRRSKMGSKKALTKNGLS